MVQWMGSGKCVLGYRCLRSPIAAVGMKVSRKIALDITHDGCMNGCATGLAECSSEDVGASRSVRGWANPDQEI